MVISRVVGSWLLGGLQVCDVSVTGALTPLHVLEHHKNLIHVLHCHPRFPRVCLSAGKDGLIRLFDFVTAESFQTTPMECEYVQTQALAHAVFGFLLFSCLLVS